MYVQEYSCGARRARTAWPQAGTSPRGLVCVVGAQEQFANYILRPASMDHARIVNVNCDAEEMNAFKLAD